MLITTIDDIWNIITTVLPLKFYDQTSRTTCD